MDETPLRARLVTTASELFYQHGIGSIGMDAIRDAAHISLRALYKEFASKEDLVVAVLQLRHEQWEQGLAAKAGDLTEPIPRLLAIFDYLTDWCRDPSFRGCGFINAFGELGPSSPRVAEAVREHKRSFQTYVDRLVDAAGGSPELAAQLALLAEGAQTTSAIAGTNDAAVMASQAARALMRDAGLSLA